MEKISSQEDYSKNGMMVKAWGPPGWLFLHTIAQNYPQEPTRKQKKEYQQFFRLIGSVLPCRYCRDSYKQFIKEPSTRLNATVMKSRQTITKWLYDIHNKVNKKLDVKEIPTFEEITAKYESLRSKCTKSPDIIERVVKKGCTDPLKGHRKKCIISFIDVDANGNPIKKNSFGKHSTIKVKKNLIKLKFIKKSKIAGKKYTATFEKNGKLKTIHFGQSSASDMTKHKDIVRRNKYIFRHHKDLKTGDPTRAGYLSMFILWNKPNLNSSIADYKRRLGIYNKTGKFPTKISGYQSPGKNKKYQ